MFKSCQTPPQRVSYVGFQTHFEGQSSEVHVYYIKEHMHVRFKIMLHCCYKCPAHKNSILMKTKPKSTKIQVWCCVLQSLKWSPTTSANNFRAPWMIYCSLFWPNRRDARPTLQADIVEGSVFRDKEGRPAINLWSTEASCLKNVSVDDPNTYQ